MSNVYGYVRVSSADQNVDRQVIAMRARGIPDRRIIIDRASGKDFNRPKYRNMVRRLKKGDTLYIHSLDRLGRSYAEVPAEWNRLSRRKGVTIKVLDMEMLDTDRPLGRIESFLMQIVLMLMSFLAEDERLRTRKRQAEGIAAARARGVKFGRPTKPLPPNFDAVFALWLAGDISGREGARRCSMPPSTFYRKAKLRRAAEGVMSA
ncbi:MAG: recombinase family protein [Desulfovibrio desulfuricans]|nr:recombinase family protein [Desulfovibrio desulfuricans]